jgi:hypothetical protein
MNLSFLKAASPCQDGGVFRSGVWHLDVPTAHAREVPVSGNGRGRLCGRFGQISDSIRNLFIYLFSLCVFTFFFKKVHHFHSEHIDHVDLKFIICSSLCIRFFFIFFPVPVPSHHPIFSIRSIIPSPRAQGAPAQ